VQRLEAGERQALARAISLVEDEDPRAKALLDALYGRTGRAYRVGITGPPGAGKSTLAAALARRLRDRGRRVGILAVDPTSPFTGGALLGDRIRMGGVAADPDVFIRSMATRGSLGGIARTTSEAADILDAAGKDVVIVETVGVGQSEVEVRDAVDTTVVVLSPESGDAVQTLKAGLMEIADVFCVNKADREGADRMAAALDAMLELGVDPHRQDAGAVWRPPVVRTAAATGAGVEELDLALERHRAHLEAAGALDRKRRERVEGKIRLLVEEKLWAHVWKGEAFERELARRGEEVLAGRATPYGAAHEIFESFVARLRGSA